MERTLQPAAASAAVRSIHTTIDRPRGGQSMIRKILAAALVAVIAAFVAVSIPNQAAAATASTQTSATPTTLFHALDSNCPAPFNLPWYTCDIRPAEMTTVNKSSSSSHTHIFIQKTTKSRITQYEKAKGVKVVIYQQPNGVTNTVGCVDPIQRGWIKNGGDFRNTRKNGSPFWTNWQAGWGICGAHKVRIGGYLYWKGTKENCGNRNILIPIGPVPPHQTFREVEFNTTTSFTSTYDKWVNHQSSSTSTHVTYPTCNYLGLGWGVAWQNGNWLCFKPNLVPVAPSPTPQPTPPSAPKPYCYMPNGAPYYGTSAPSGFTLQGNQCVVITVICGNIGNNNGGNCNTTQPPSTPPSTPPAKPIIGCITTPEHITETVNPAQPETSPIHVCLTGIPGGHVIDVTFSTSGMGSFQTNPVKITTNGTGNDDAYGIFVAPSETGTVTVTAIAYDETTKQTSAPVTSGSFGILDASTATSGRPNN